ncbi:MAG: HypC/HybG/HupF family hydrogenase formation chaperone [Firmicutes bacterium]|nr:HypC/HybG/HupF family hydrogenase formation chaperone [Bacillota bacterium]
MCVAFMGRVESIDDKIAVVNCGGAKIKARRDLVNISVGDCVMVHAGYVMQRVSDEDIALMEELG